ncbi:MAG: iron chelate uptake ABC transporter family permease subunit, partial [Neisseria sp.]|nr:iron chelate uptake ABC transporter family permease subunit [Neisseria sp.]
MNDSVVAEIVRNQRRLEGKRWLIVLMFLIIAAVSFLFDIATGPAMTDTLPVGEVVNVLLGKPETDEMNRLIVMDLRLPIAVMALVVGAALGVGGAEIQTLLNNPMASP